MPLEDCQPGTGLVLRYEIDHALLIESWNEETGERTCSVQPLCQHTSACAQCATRLVEEGSTITRLDTLPLGEKLYCGHCLATHHSTHGPIH